MSKSEADIVFLSLVFNIQSAALQQMGKMVNPLSGKMERSLDGAKQSIDLLECLERKTRGNLSSEEERAMQKGAAAKNATSAAATTPRRRSYCECFVLSDGCQ